MLASRLADRVQVSAGSLSREAPLPGDPLPLEKGPFRAASARLGLHPRGSGSSPPIGHISRSAFLTFLFFFFEDGGEEEELFLFKFFSLYVDTKRKRHWACSDIEWFADKQQPPGTKDLNSRLPHPTPAGAANGICQTDDKVRWTESHSDSVLSRTHGSTPVITVYSWPRLTRRGQTQEEIKFPEPWRNGCVLSKGWGGYFSDMLQVVLESTVHSTFLLKGVRG